MGGVFNELSISVLTSPTTKDLITSKYLPTSSEIGVFVTNSSGDNYDGNTYNNILFTAEGSDASQIWTGASTIELSMNEGKCYAYYPYSLSASDVTKIPVSTANQCDYLYATPVTVDANNKNAVLSMNHALSAVRFMIKKGSYSGTGKVTAVSVQSSALGTSANLNAKTGKLTDVSGTGAEISVSKSLTLNEATQDVDVIVVPTEVAADMTLSVTVDGKTYYTVVSGAAVTRASCNKYALTVNQGELALSGIEIGDWGYDDSGALTITAGSYKVTFAGDYNDIAFANSVTADGTINITAASIKENFRPKVVTASGCSLTQSVSSIYRKITLSNISSDITLVFSGIESTGWADLADGVYAVKADGSPVVVSEATTDCIGVAIVNSATQQKLMIEKYEDANSSYATAASGKNSTKYFYWGGYGTDQSIVNYASSSEAKLDYNGKINSEVLKTVTAGGGSYTSFATLGTVLNVFNNNSDDNQGYTDWFVPACGQLYLIYQNRSNIDSALSAIGGTQLVTTYWSSSENSASSSWGMNFGKGSVEILSKTIDYRVRFVRNL